MMIGLIKPRILLPTVEMERNELRFILTHELVHYKRKDLLYKYLVLMATALHWFNPVVYLMAKSINALCETSCDAEILRSADVETRQSYGEAIIGVVQYQSKMKTALSTTFYGGKKGMKKRIASVMDTQSKKLGTVIISLVLVATLCTGFVFTTNAMASGNQNPAGLFSGFSVGDTISIPVDRDAAFRMFSSVDELLAGRFLDETVSVESWFTLHPSNSTNFVSGDELRVGDRVSIPWSDSTRVILSQEEMKRVWERLQSDGVDAIENREMSFEPVAVNAEFGIIVNALVNAMLSGNLPLNGSVIDVSGPLQTFIIGMDEFLVNFGNGYVDLLADAEVYSLIQDGANLWQIATFLSER
jgi:hypothetical protein